MRSEDEVYKIICEEWDNFRRNGPAKTLGGRWQRKAARRIMELFEPKRRERPPFVYED